MNRCIFTLEDIAKVVKPLTEKYHVKAIYLFGSYARGEADENSDVDFLVYIDEGFRLTNVLALGEELREALQKRVDIFEIHEINKDSDFYRNVIKEKVLIVWYG